MQSISTYQLHIWVQTCLRPLDDQQAIDHSQTSSSFPGFGLGLRATDSSDIAMRSSSLARNYRIIVIFQYSTPHDHLPPIKSTLNYHRLLHRQAKALNHSLHFSTWIYDLPIFTIIGLYKIHWPPVDNLLRQILTSNRSEHPDVKVPWLLVFPGQYAY